ncbi:hypothetical protein MKW94_021356 [Papaver nudicaule]|uniref:Transposase n=1 Tax=Papaver nudicaule TaxID=74823 RepID=A0AA41S4X1_PAPNU|nr:hypothetical protein [Papaver nudicaule]
MAQQQSTSSYHTSSSQQNGATSSSTTPKTLVELDIAGLPIGDNASPFMTQAGDLIRRHIPINKTDWRIVPQKYKDDVWNTLMGEYEFNVDHVRSVIETKFPKIFRRYKSDLRKYVIKGQVRKKATKKRSQVEESEEQDEENGEGELPEVELTPELWEAAKLKVPAGMHRVIWEEFVENERKDEQIQKNAKNSQARKAQKIRHTLGRQSYSNKAYKLGDSDVKVIPGETTDKWLLGHQRKDGSVHPTAVEAHEKVKQAKEKNKEIGESSSSLVSPALEDVFGSTRKDGIRGYSSSVSKKQGEMAAIMKSALKKQETESETRLNAIESQVGQLLGTVASVQGEVGSVDGTKLVEG